MKTAEQLLEELNTLDEHTTIEAKTATQVGSSLMETVCAFANEPNLGGGYLLLGVAAVEDSFWPVYEAVGVPDADQLQCDIANQCASMFNTVIRPQIMVESIHGKNVVVVFVSEAGTHEKPVHFKGRPLPKSAFRRIGPTDQRCTEDDLIVFYTDRQGQSYDEQIVPDARLDDLDEEAIDLYRQLRHGVDPQAEELSWKHDDLLEALGAVKRQDGELIPTVAGVLLFGKSIALRRLFPMMRIDYIRVPGTKWIEDPDRRFDTVEIRSPLIRAIQRSRSAVLDDLPKAFSLPAGEVQGKDMPLLPDRVVREVVANAVMHRDYRVHGSIQIIRYANRLEIRNPGYSIKAEERLGEPGSQTRNPKIAAILHDVKFAETKGSGIRVMRDLMGEGDLLAPILRSDRTDNSFLAVLSFHHFLGQDDHKWLASFKEYGLTEEEMRAMISAREIGAIDNSSYRDLNRDSDTLSASKHLRKLCDHGLLKKKGSGPKTYYVPTEKALENWPPATSEESKPPELEVLPPELSTLSPELEALPPELRVRIDKLGQRAKIGELNDAILMLLHWKELSLADLAGLLGRSQDHIRKTYLNSLVAADRVQLSNPDNPTDPRQTYRVASTGSGQANDSKNL